jgi:hypothetical protein
MEDDCLFLAIANPLALDARILAERRNFGRKMLL